MTVDFLALASLGFLETEGEVVTAPVITSADNKDGTGVVISITGYDVGSINTLYLAKGNEAFVSKGSVWTADKMALTLANAVYWAYVESGVGDVYSTSPMIRVKSSNEQAAADDNINVAVKIMVHSAVYWPPATIWDEFGKPVPEDPIEIGCRWEEKAEQFIDTSGTEQISQAVVVVDRDVVIGGVLMLGELGDIVDAVNPKNNVDSWEIKSFSKLPDFQGSKYFRKVYL